MPARHCPNGSEPFPLAMEVAFLEAGDVLLIADLIGSPLLDFLIFPFVDAAFDVATLCNSDPPDPPTFTATDFLDPAQLSGKAQILIQSYMWDFWCQCIGGGLPPTPDWDVSDVRWGTAANLLLDPNGWPEVHIAGKQWGISDAIGYPNVQQDTAGWWVFFKGTADVTPYANNGKPTTQSELSSAQLGYWIEWYGYQPTWPGYNPDLAGHFYVKANQSGGVILEGGPTEVLGGFYLGVGKPGPPDPPDIPDTIHFPADVEATLEDIRNRIKALEAKLDRLIPMADARLPHIVDGWIKELVAGDIVEVDIYTIAADGFLVDLTTIPATAGSRFGPVPLYEVNARALQLGWVAWTETSDEPGWKWQRLDMASTWIAAAEGTIQSVEVSLMPGVVADLYKLIRHYA